jgi:hypothetical protein
VEIGEEICEFETERRWLPRERRDSVVAYPEITGNSLVINNLGNGEALARPQFPALTFSGGIPDDPRYSRPGPHAVGEVTKDLGRSAGAVGLGASDGRDGFTGIPFLSLPTLAGISGLDGTVVFVNGPLSPAARHDAGVMFTVGQSVDTLLNVFARPLPIPPAAVVWQLEELIAAPSAGDPRTPRPGSALSEKAPSAPKFSDRPATVTGLLVTAARSAVSVSEKPARAYWPRSQCPGATSSRASAGPHDPGV